MKLAASFKSTLIGRSGCADQCSKSAPFVLAGRTQHISRSFKTSSTVYQRGPSIPPDEGFLRRKLNELEFPPPPDPLEDGKPLPLLKLKKKVGTTVPKPVEIPNNWIDYEPFPLLHPQYRFTQQRAKVDKLKEINRVPGTLFGLGRPPLLLHFPIGTIESYISKRMIYAGKYCRVVLPDGICVLAEVQHMQLHAISLRPRSLSLQQRLPEGVKWPGSMEPLVLRRYPKGVFAAARAKRDNTDTQKEVPLPTEEEMKQGLAAAQALFPTQRFELDLTPPKRPLITS